MKIARRRFYAAWSIVFVVIATVMGLLVVGWIMSVTTSTVDLSVVSRFFSQHEQGMLLWRLCLYGALFMAWPKMARAALRHRGQYSASPAQIDRFRWKLVGFICMFELFIVQNLLGRIL